MVMNVSRLSIIPSSISSINFSVRLFYNGTNPDIYAIIRGVDESFRFRKTCYLYMCVLKGRVLIMTFETMAILSIYILCV